MKLFRQAFNLAVAIWLPWAFIGPAGAQSEPTIDQVYQAANAGRLAEADKMIEQVLRDHPNSAKAHFVRAELAARESNAALAQAELAKAEGLAQDCRSQNRKRCRRFAANSVPALGYKNRRQGRTTIPAQPARWRPSSISHCGPSRWPSHCWPPVSTFFFAAKVSSLICNSAALTPVRLQARARCPQLTMMPAQRSGAPR